MAGSGQPGEDGHSGAEPIGAGCPGQRHPHDAVIRGGREVGVEPALRPCRLRREHRQAEQPALARVHDAGHDADIAPAARRHQLHHGAGIALADQGRIRRAKAEE